jgi:Ca-activated chloride channel family protein
MNQTKLLPDDPRITAYALGELEGAERSELEKAVRYDPALRVMVAEIRATAVQLEAALSGEGVEGTGGDNVVPFPATGSAVAVHAESDGGRESGGDPYSAEKRKSMLRYPRFYFAVGGLAAACFAVMAMLTPPPPAPPPVVAKTEKVYIPMTEAMASALREEPAKGENGAAPAATPATPDTMLAPKVGLPAPGTLAAGGTEKTPADVSPALPASQAPIGSVAATTPATTGGTEPFPSKTVEAPALNLLATAPTNPMGEPAAMPPEAPGVAVAMTEPPGTLLGTVPAQNGGGELMKLAPFTMSAERLRARIEANKARELAAQQAEPVVSLVGGTAGGSPDLSLLPSNARYARALNNANSYAYLPENEFVKVKKNPLSSFSVEVDTASYSNVRRFVQNKQRLPREAVRIEELLNYFPYHYPPPGAKSEAPLAASLEVADAPWAPTHRLVRIGLKAREVTTAERGAANLVFLVDVSGSMNAANRLPLVKESMRLLLGKLRPDDRVAIVTYAGNSGLSLPSTPVSRASDILEALDGLSTGGSTNGSLGIHLAYDIAKANLVNDGINRVILCTDGDFNVGTTNEGDLVQLIEDKARSGVFLTVLGFGMNSRQDNMLERLADKGSGNYGYIDSRKEAEKILVQQVNGTLVTVAKDVRIQVEFNPAQVASYRLIGYESRADKTKDDANDKVDAGEVGAGHTVTALYEVIPAAGAKPVEPDVEERRYNFYGGVADYVPNSRESRARDLLTVRVSYKKPDGLLSRRLDFPLRDAGKTFAQATPDFKFAAAVASFGMILRESPHKGLATMANVIEWAEAGMDDDIGGYRSEFIELARHADTPEK